MTALAVSCLFPEHWAPWCDLDAICRGFLARFLRSTNRAWPLDEGAWKKSYKERIALFKYAVWGFVLILLLPLSPLSASAWVVTPLGSGLEELRKIIVSLSGQSWLFLQGQDFQAAPYELWEICVFLWVFPMIGRWITVDYIRLATASRIDIGAHVKTGQSISRLILGLSIIGALFLVITQHPLYRVLVELIIIATLAGADLYFCRRWLALGRLHEAVNHFEAFLVVNLGAFVAFAVLYLFLVMTKLPYGSYWSSAFVAGASALNLLFANTASLIIRGIQHYREERQAVEEVHQPAM
jgi:hypothetical protein